jgi:hypothetical protein
VRYLDDPNAGEVFATGFATDAYEAGQQPVTFLVYRDERLPWASRVYFSISGTATSPSLASEKFGTADYTMSGMHVNFIGGNSGYVDIPASQTLTLVTLTPIWDSRIEPNETAVFSIIPGSGYLIGTPSSVVVTIHDSIHVHPQAATTTGATNRTTTSGLTTASVASMVFGTTTSTTPEASIFSDKAIA